MEEYNPTKHPEHLEAKKKYTDKLDGMVYVRRVIEWHVCKVGFEAKLPLLKC